MSNQDQDPRDEIDQRQGAPRPGDEPKKQQVLGPLDPLGDSTLTGVDFNRLDLDQAVATAHKYPRDLKTVIGNIKLMALYDEAAAQRSIYALPRADKPIVGPSIGFANILSIAWGNCRDAGYWVRTDRKEMMVVCQGVFFDLQSNRITLGSSVRRISSKSRTLYSDDMIAVTIQAASAIARRNAILAGVPRPLWQPVYEEVLVVVRGTEATLGERRAKMVASFANFGITPEKVLGALGIRKESEITLDHIVMLRGMFEALRDGDITPEEMFDPRRMIGIAHETVENPLGDDAHAEGEPKGPDAPPDTGAPAAAPKPQAASAASAARKPQETKKPQGKGKPAPKANGATSAAAAAKAAAAKAAPAPRSEPEPPEPDEPVQADADRQPDPPEPEGDKPADEPKTSQDYVAHALAYIEAATNASELRNRWKGEKGLRTQCSVIGSDFETVSNKLYQKLGQLDEATQA